MKYLAALLSLCTILVTGCATAPQQAQVDLNLSAIPKQQVIGIYVSSVPKITTSFPGAGCLLCLGAASIANSSLTKQVETFQADQLAQVAKKLTEQLQAKGYKTLIVEQLISDKKLPKVKPVAGSTINRNYSSYKELQGIDQLLVVNFTRVGVDRQYSSYIAVAEPHAIISAQYYMIDLASNSYSLFTPLNIMKNADGEWDAPPVFPGITNAFYQSEEEAIDFISKQIK